MREILHGKTAVDGPRTSPPDLQTGFDRTKERKVGRGGVWTIRNPEGEKSRGNDGFKVIGSDQHAEWRPRECGAMLCQGKGQAKTEATVARRTDESCRAVFGVS